MQIFLIGKTKTGKTTLANQLKEVLQNKDLKVYEAGQWARNEFAQMHTQTFNEFDLIFKEELTKYALSKLKEDPFYSIKQFEKWIDMNNSKDLMIAGVRNPDDFIEMLKKDNINKIIFINTSKKMGVMVEAFEDGIEVIKNYTQWKSTINNNISFLNVTEDEVGNQELLIKLKEWL